MQPPPPAFQVSVIGAEPEAMAAMIVPLEMIGYWSLYGVGSDLG